VRAQAAFPAESLVVHLRGLARVLEPDEPPARMKMGEDAERASFDPLN
jgi:hypothetical protein